MHSETKALVLMPVGWETHAQPTMGDRPQAIINEQLLKGCDILVGIFWTRLGTPTGASASGTVEEIEEHISAGKTAMLYFSEEPVVLRSVDGAQYEALLAFRTRCESRGFIESYTELAEFHEKFRRQLAQHLNARFPGRALGHADEAAENDGISVVVGGEARIDIGRRVAEALSLEPKQLLTAAAAHDGTILRVRTFGGLDIQVGDRNFVSERGNARLEAKWEGAITQLRSHDLVSDIGVKGELFRLTDYGYQIADLVADERAGSSDTIA